MLLFGTSAAILGGMLAYLLRNGGNTGLGNDISDEADAFVEVNTKGPPKVDAITYAEIAKLPAYDWPCLFGPHGSIIEYPLELPKWPQTGPPVLWRMSVGEGYSAPVVQGKNLVLLHRLADEECVECRDAETGDLHWAFRYPTAYESPVAYSNGPYSTPTIVEDRVYTIGAETKMHCLRLTNGELLWSRDLKAEYELGDTNYNHQEFYGFCPSPLQLDSSLIVNIGARDKAAGIVAIDQLSGETLWESTSDGASYATPVAAEVAGHPVAIVLSRDALVMLEAADGSVLFREEFRSKNPDTTNASSPLVVNDTVFACGYGVGAMGVNLPSDGFEPEVLWRERRSLDAQYTNLFALDGHIIGYPSRLKGTLMALDLATGDVQWEFTTGYARGNGLFINGELILLSEEGDLLRCDNLPGKPILTSAIERYLQGPCYTGPVFAHGRMFLRTERELICVQLF